MTFDVEILVRYCEHVFTEQLSHDRELADWTYEDAGAVLRKILQTVGGVMRVEQQEDRGVSLRGMSWIVSPFQDGVVIAFEIDSASVVAGPFAIAQDELDRLVARAVQDDQPPEHIH